MEKTKLGKTVRDTLTGFNGIATGQVTYLTGCNQTLIQPPVNAEGAWVESRWIDDDRLIIVAEATAALPITSAGGDKAAPRR